MVIHLYALALCFGNALSSPRSTMAFNEHKSLRKSLVVMFCFHYFHCFELLFGGWEISKLLKLG